MKHPNRSVMMLPLGAPAARAVVRGDASHPALRGKVAFYHSGGGTVMTAEFTGLPYDPAPCAANICALHIHAVGECVPPFASAGGHYNPGNCPHPAHAGDLPPLFSNRGFAWQAFYTERFRPEDVIGKSVIVHDRRDDFTSQPAGDAGNRIACGVIEKA